MEIENRCRLRLLEGVLVTVDVMEASHKEAATGLCQAEAGVRYVARQAILDYRGRVTGYELLFRDRPSAGFSGDGEQATRTMLDNLVVFDLERFTGGAPAFINCTEETLTSGLPAVISPESAVLEVLETVRPRPEVVESCRKLKAAGFRIALDDFVWQEEWEPLVEVADYIKVDFVQSGPAERHEIIQRLRKKRVALVAEKIETQAEYEQALREGFKLFQGYYFCHPELLANRAIPANLQAQMELIQALKSEEMDFPHMERMVKRDPAITYRLLRMVNSAAFGMRWNVRSIKMAMVAVGEEQFRRIAILAIAVALCPAKAREALRMALVRARFCEMSAVLAGYDATEQYLLGLFSLLPAMMQIPMERAVEKINFRAVIREALMGADHEEASLLRWMESSERGDWQLCDGIAEQKRLDGEELSRNVMAAVVWADGMLQPV